jgi:hypothetical protein
MSQVDEVLKFDEFETSMKTHLEKVDPRLIVDCLSSLLVTEKNQMSLTIIKMKINLGKSSKKRR